MVCNVIRNQNVTDAQVALGNFPRKGARIVNELLEKAILAGERKGFVVSRMYVHTVTVGRAKWFEKVDIKGRGRTGRIRTEKTSLRLVLAERSPSDFFEMVLKGETPKGVAQVFRRMLFQNFANFEHVRAASHMTTSEGRRYRRVQFQRLV